MLAKLIVSLYALAAIAVAAPTNQVTVEQCNNFGIAQCCNIVGQFDEPRVVAAANHLGVVVDAADAAVGLLCTSISAAGGAQCSQEAVCCQSSERSSLVNVQCLPIIL